MIYCGWFFIIIGLSLVLGQNTQIQLNGNQIDFNFADVAGTTIAFDITDACPQPLYTVEILSAINFNGGPCFDVSLLNAAGVAQTVGLPNLDKQPSGLTYLLVRKPAAPCAFETILITKFTGGPAACSGSLWANPSLAEAKDINTLTQTATAIGKKQYHFYQFNNLVPGSFYAMLFQMPIAAFPYYDNAIEYPTQYNCKFKLTAQTPPFSFSVIQASATVESIGVNSPAASTYSIQTYLTTKETLTVGVFSNTVTVQPNQYSFYTLPLTIPAGTTVQLFPTTALGTPLMWITSPMDTPTTFDTMAPTITPITVGTVIPVNNPNNHFASIFNPNQNAVTYKVMLVNGAVVTGTATGVTTGAITPPALVPTQNVLLALPLPAIIGIAVGIAAFIAIIIGSVFIYSKRKGKRAEARAKADYKPVPTQNNKKESKRKENTPSSSSTESDSETDEEEEEEVERDDYDSYQPRRGGGRDRRTSRRGGGGRDYGGRSNVRRPDNRSRERSYSDDDEDDYSSDDYS